MTEELWKFTNSTFFSAALSQSGTFLCNDTKIIRILRNKTMRVNTIFYEYSWYGCILYTPEVPAVWGKKNEAEWKKTFLPPTQPSRAPFQHNAMFGFASVSGTQGRFSWRFKMHFHHLLSKVSLFAHRQQDSKACHVCCRASSPTLTMAQRVHLPVSTGTRFLGTGSEWGRIFHLKSGKCAPMTIRAHLRRGLIELHGFSNWRQRTLYLEMLRLGRFS